MGLRVLVAAALCALAALIASAAPATAAWEPSGPEYDVGSEFNVPVRMADGVTLRVNVEYPTIKSTGARAPGPFPVLLIQTPYGKGKPAGPESGESPVKGLGIAGGPLVERGYIAVTADIRGTGTSEGSFGLFDPSQVRDGVELVHWAAQRPNSSGKVGTLGPSYLGIIQLLVAAEIGPSSPLKAIFPLISANEVYRDAAFDGGMLDFEFSAAYLALLGGLNTVNPFTGVQSLNDLQQLAKTSAQHADGFRTWQLALTADVFSDGDLGYDEGYWTVRSPVTTIAKIAANKIPAYFVGGWYDLFQRGTPLNYSGLQNAFRGRSVLAPMLPDQAPTGRYQLMMGPWYHVTTGTGVDMLRIQEQWFDHWLKGEKTGIDQTTEPMRLYDLGTGKWVSSGRYPFDAAKPTSYFLGAGRSLSPAKPTVASGSDTVPFTGGSIPCSRATEQWSAGAASLAFKLAGLGNQPCAEDATLEQAGPGALNFTTAPFSDPKVLAGPIGVTLHAASTRSQTEFITTISDVAPNGKAKTLTSGALLGTKRALNPALSWKGQTSPILPYHHYTRATLQPITPGRVTEHNIEVRPTFATIKAGHRLRLTISTSDVPHLMPTPRQIADMVGATFAIQRTAAAPSHVEFPLAPVSAFGPNAKPTANAVARRSGSSRTRFRFDGRASIDPDGRISAYEWRTGGRVVSRRSTFARSFSTARGVHRVHLKVTDNRGATATTSVLVRPRTGESSQTVTLPASVTFCSGCSRLSTRGRTLVRGLRREARGSDSVSVAGHTDSVGTAASNMRLGRRRAHVVSTALLDGLAPRPKRVQVLFYGEKRPIATNRTSAGRARNRRVEIRIVTRG